MKSPLYSFFIVASSLVAIAHCFPGVPLSSLDSIEENEKKALDTILVLPRLRNPLVIPRQFPGLPALPNLDGIGDDSLEELNPFGLQSTLDSLMKRMQDTMNRVAAEMAGLLPSIQVPESLIPWGAIPDGGNTTSTTKIIDGHVVTMNETTYQSDDDNSHVVFRLHTVDVKPLNQTLNADDTTDVDIGGGEEVETVTVGPPSKQGEKEETTTQARSVETVEDFGNEIPKGQADTLTA